MRAWAKPGVKCVCINGGSPSCNGAAFTGGLYPVTGRAYTIKATRVDRQDGKLLLVLGEIPDVGPTTGWDASRFRPLTTKTQEQDVALFRHLLADLPVGVDA